jgi:hypothetical protein
MNRNVCIFSVTWVFACLFGISESSAAQRALTPPFSQPVGFHLGASAAVRAESAGVQSAGIPRDDNGPVPGLHFLTGAAIGALAAGIWGAVEISKTEDCMMCPAGEAMAIGAGAVVGGVAGLFVYVMRKQAWEQSNRRNEPQPAK